MYSVNITFFKEKPPGLRGMRKKSRVEAGQMFTDDVAKKKRSYRARCLRWGQLGWRTGETINR